MKEGINVTKVLCVGNLKGGVGKTTTATQIAFNLAYNKHMKTLLVDLDPQGNASTILLKTKLNFDKKANTHAKASLMRAVQDEDLNEALINIYTNLVDHLDLLASSADFYNYSRFMEEKFPNSYQDRVTYFDKLTKDLFSQYDFVILDTPPTVSLLTDSALFASDWILVVTQTQQQSLEGALTYLKYLQNTVINKLQAPRLDIIGILRVMLDKNSSLDQAVMDDIENEFGKENILPTIIHSQNRLKRWGRTGITVSGYFDKKALATYDQVTSEILERIKQNEQLTSHE